MNTVYIVDDEAIVLDGLVNWVEWSKIDVKVLGTATSGSTALNDILYFKPDVVITDIRMPGKDGLELIHEVQKVLPQTVFIVLSGYNEFSYAQKAIHYGVKEYLLKPVDEEKVLQVVEKALVERKCSGREAMYPNNLDNVKAFELFRNMLNPNVEERDKIPPVTIAVCDIAEHTDDLHKVAAKLGDLNMGEQGIYYSRNYTEFIVFCMNPDKKKMRYYLGEIVNVLEESLREQIYFGICNWKQRDCSFYHAYIHSRQSGLIAKFYCIPQIEWGEILEEWKEDPFEKKELFAEICRDEDTERFLEMYWQNYRQACTLKVKPQILKREVIAALQFFATAFMNKYGIIFIQGKQMQTLLNSIEDSESFQYLGEIMEQVLKQMHNVYFEYCQDYKAKVIGKIKQFIDENMDQPLDIAMIASYVNMSQNYVSSYFKKNTGMVLSEFVLKEKMERALLLLRNSTMKINHIAAEVGFSDPKYFCKVFKKYTGITASDYRKK